MSDLIDRQAAINEVSRFIGYIDEDMIERIQIGLKRLPTAQPNLQPTCNQLATDCIDRQAAIDGADAIIARDTSGNNDVVKAMTAWKSYVEALPSAQPEQRWIPVKPRPMDEEERKEWSEKLGYDLADDEAVIYSNLPDDGQECIVCTKWGNVFIDTFLNDSDYGCAFEDHGDMDGITAWMPLPKPWKGERNE